MAWHTLQAAKVQSIQYATAALMIEEGHCSSVLGSKVPGFGFMVVVFGIWCFESRVSVLFDFASIVSIEGCEQG